MKTKRMILVISILIGVLAAFSVRAYINSQEEEPVDPIVYRKVAVAVSTIPENTILTSEMVELRDVPEQSVHQDAFTEVSELIGAVSSHLLVKDEQVLNGRVVLGRENDANKLSYQIPENMRAISIPIHELAAVSGYIKQGDLVDILVMYQLSIANPTQNEAEEPSTDPIQDGAEPNPEDTPRGGRTTTYCPYAIPAHGGAANGACRT